MLKKYRLIIIFILITGKLFSGQEYISFNPVFIKHYRGLISLRGIFRTMLEDQQIYLLQSNFKLNSSFFVWDPDILNFEFEGEYSPEINTIKFPAMPDYSETYNMNRLHLQTDIFRTEPLNVNIFGDISNSYQTRDFGGSTKNESKSYGISSTFYNIILPIMISYNFNDYRDRDQLTGINFLNTSQNLSVSLSRDIGGFLLNGGNVFYQKNTSSYFDTNTYKISSLGGILTNTFLIPGNFMSINSSLSYSGLEGNRARRSLSEHLSTKIDLPARFSIDGDYNYISSIFDSTQNINHAPRVQINHKLYSNLSSQLHFEKRINKQKINSTNSYEDNITNYVGNFNYSKKITTGRFGFGYNYKLSQFQKNNPSSDLIVRNEEYRLEDGKQTILRYPNIDETSIVVMDVTGTVIYQNNVDYIILKDNLFFQIFRIPSGRIVNNSSVFIDYKALIGGKSKYDAVNQGISAFVSLFDGFISLNFNYSDMSFKNIDVSEQNLLRTEERKHAGFHVSYNTLLVSGNYTIYNSNYAPYKSYDVNLTYTVGLFDGLSTTFLTNLSSFKYDNPKTENINVHANFKSTYNPYKWMYFIGQANYRYSKILSFNLSYINVNAELKLFFLQTLLTFGFDYYNSRYYSSSTASAYGAYIRLERAFGYF